SIRISLLLSPPARTYGHRDHHQDGSQQPISMLRNRVTAVSCRFIYRPNYLAPTKQLASPHEAHRCRSLLSILITPESVSATQYWTYYYAPASDYRQIF